MHVSLRPETSADGPFLRNLLIARLTEELCAWAWEEKIREPLLNLQFNAQQQGIVAMYPSADRSVILAGGHPAGRLVVARLEHEIHLVDIALLGEFQNAGLGTRIIADLLAEADTAAKPVRLHVNVGNRARRLYERAGFVRVGGDEVQLLMERAPSKVSKSSN